MKKTYKKKSFKRKSGSPLLSDLSWCIALIILLSVNFTFNSSNITLNSFSSYLSIKYKISSSGV
jgi:hypothetical protein